MNLRDQKKAWLDKAIRESGMTLKKLAEGLDVDQSVLSRARRGGGAPSDATIEKVARFLGINPPDMHALANTVAEPPAQYGQAPQKAANYEDQERELNDIRKTLLRVLIRLDDVERELASDRRHKRAG